MIDTKPRFRWRRGFFLFLAGMQTPWIKRSFPFAQEANILPAVIERLRGTQLRLAERTLMMSEQQAGLQPEGKWSVKQQIGHLTELEQLWIDRLEELLKGAAVLKPADMSNLATEEAGHNDRSLPELISGFAAIRMQFVSRLSNVKENEVFFSALHERLGKQMRVLDLALFAAEHDDHHLARITEIRNSLPAD